MIFVEVSDVGVRRQLADVALVDFLNRANWRDITKIVTGTLRDGRPYVGLFSFERVVGYWGSRNEMRLFMRAAATLERLLGNPELPSRWVLRDLFKFFTSAEPSQINRATWCSYDQQAAILVALRDGVPFDEAVWLAEEYVAA